MTEKMLWTDNAQETQWVHNDSGSKRLAFSRQLYFKLYNCIFVVFCFASRIVCFVCFLSCFYVSV